MEYKTGKRQLLTMYNRNYGGLDYLQNYTILVLFNYHGANDPNHFKARWNN